MAAIPDYIGDMLRFDRSSRDTERMHDVQMQQWLYNLTKQQTDDKLDAASDPVLLNAIKALSPTAILPQTAPAAPPSDTSGGATTQPYMSAPPIQTQSMPTPQPGQSSQAMLPPGGAPPNPMAQLTSPQIRGIAEQPPDLRAALMQMLLKAGPKGTTPSTVSQPPGGGPPVAGYPGMAGGPSPVAPMQGPGPVAGPAPTPNAATGGWTPSNGAKQELGGKPPAQVGAPDGNQLGAPPQLPSGQGIEPAKMPSTLQLIAQMDKAGVDPKIQIRAITKYSKIEDAESQRAIQMLRVKADISRAAADAARAKADEWRARLAEQGGKPPAPSPAVKMYREANDPNASPEERAIAKKELDVSLATTSAKLSAAQDANAPIDAGQVGQAKTGEPYSQIVPGWGAAASNKRQKLATATMDALQEENPSMSRKEIGEDLAWRQANWGGQVRSETQLQLMQSTTVQANKQLHFNVDQVSQLEKEMPGANLSPILNAIIRGEEKWTGDPKYSQLFYYMYAAGTESARLLSGGQASIQQLHEGAREEAKQWANAGWTTPDAWVKGVSVAMDKEADNKIQTYSDAMDYMKKRMKQGATSPDTSVATTKPTASDLQWVKNHPEDAAKFRAHFGIDPPR